MTLPNLNLLLGEGLERERRQDDGLLHPSTDLSGSLRHTQLRLAGVPAQQTPLPNMVRLRTGTMWHEYFEQILRGVPVMREVDVTPGLPHMWAGTADFLFWSSNEQAFVLADLKTINPRGLDYTPKSSHVEQISSYYSALQGMGIPLTRQAAIYYLPTEEREPKLRWVTPLPDIEIRMGAITAEVADYLLEVDITGEILNDKLAPELDRVQSLTKKGDKYEVILVPHWLTRYCPYDLEWCSCSTLGRTKIGQYEKVGDGYVYIPRKGYENYTPNVYPGVF